ncbi:MAG: sugar phosphate isomerase/epimerase [Gemmataceae bacterium]|nr:sugar phosphate isomerase/epimerase [Gemmataceae bacterium]
MTPCISQACTLPHSFADDVAAYPAGGAVELWLTKLEQHLSSASADDTVKLLADRGLRPVAAALRGGLLVSQGEQRRAHFDHLKRRLDLCQRFGVPVLVVGSDFGPTADPTAIGRSLVSLAEAARWAAGFGVKLALEFRGQDAFCNNLDTALTLVERCGEGSVGVCLDVFHYYKGPSKPDDLDRLTAANLAHVQVCDVAGVPRELMADADRVMPGDGDFRLGPIVERLKAIGYAGAVSLELPNPVLWQLPPAQVADAGATALGRLLGGG